MQSWQHVEAGRCSLYSADWQKRSLCERYCTQQKILKCQLQLLGLIFAFGYLAAKLVCLPASARLLPPTCRGPLGETWVGSLPQQDGVVADWSC